MKNFLKNLFSWNKSEQMNPEEKIRKELENAVRADDVQKVYKLLNSSIEDINSQVLEKVTRYIDDYPDEITERTCLLNIARSEPMKRLLRHFGALSLSELEKIWRQEEDEKLKQQERERAEKRQKEEERARQKTEADDRFLDSVLR